MTTKTTAAELKAGDAAPDFSLADDSGKTIRLSELKGKSVVLYFYPADDTPGCTKEACSFRDNLAEIKVRGAVVLGVSPDTAESHGAFRSKYKLTFPLLVDAGHKLASAYGAWGKRNLYGREITGIIRSTFVIGPDGRLKKAFRHVRVDGHTEQVLAALSQP